MNQPKYPRSFQFGLRTVLVWILPYLALLLWVASWPRPLQDDPESIADAIRADSAMAAQRLLGWAVVTAVWIALISLAMIVRRRKP